MDSDRTNRIRVVVHDGVSLRGNHGNVRTGTCNGVDRSGDVVLVMDEPDGRIAGPFHPGEYTIIPNHDQ